MWCRGKPRWRQSLQQVPRPRWPSLWVRCTPKQGLAGPLPVQARQLAPPSIVGCSCSRGARVRGGDGRRVVDACSRSPGSELGFDRPGKPALLRSFRSTPGWAGASTRGSAQRNRLLASGWGGCYSAVLANIARRMSPASTPSSDPAVLLNQGVCLTRYYERFGGFGQSKGLAVIAFQVAMAMDAMQAGKIEQCQDHLALLAVSLELASLDGGRMDLAYQTATGGDVFQSLGHGPLEEQAICAASLPALGDSSACVSKRDGGHPNKTPRRQQGKGFRCWIRAATGCRGRPTNKASSQTKQGGLDTLVASLPLRLTRHAPRTLLGAFVAPHL